jgi:spore coat protein U-like protein
LEAGSAFTSTGTGAAQSLTATGRLSRVQGSSPDMYTDLITVTLTY